LPTDILISSDPWENRVAILEDGRLAEIYVEREERVIGSIYKGKVVNVLPGMGASFVDIGLGRNAFLYVDDINKTPLNIGDVEVTSGRSGYTITEKVSRGDDVLVQIVKEPRGLKGARVSTNISLPGRYLILMPTGKFSGVSRKIESVEERNRLKAIMKAIRPDGMATVVRTAAGGVSNAELIADLGILIRMWHGILEQFKRVASPALLHKDMNLVYKTARDFITPDVDHVWLDDETETENVKDFMRLLGPQYVDRIKYYDGGKRLFTDFKIDDEIHRLMKPTVKLPSGGSIVIESTEALTVVDVNSGKFTGGKNLDDTIVRTNVEAATEVARQVRLRDIGGIIVCDFIDMSSEHDRNRVITALQEGLRKDRTRSTIQSFSPLGLLEFTRKRVGKDLGQQLRGKCPTCEGLGSVMSPESVAIGAFREILAHKNGASTGSEQATKHVHIAAAPQVAAQAEYWYEDERVQLAERVGTQIDVFVDPAVHPERPRIIWGGANIPTLAPIRVGDEFEVELLNIRLPNATSAAAIVAGRLIEVENAANATGKTIKIKILDVDGSDILAEPRSPVEAATAIGEGRKKRRRGGQGRKRELTAAEQAAELRALAEEAEKGLGGRTSIGISTTEEVVAKKTGPKTTAQKAADGSVALLPGESLSGTRLTSVSSGAGAAMLPGEKLSGDRIGAGSPPPAAIRPAPAAAAAPGDAEHETEEGGRRRRRRRRRGGRGADPAAGPGQAASAAAPLRRAGGAAVATLEADDEDEDEAVAVAPGTAAAEGAEGERKRRRRRRRRRGRGGAGADGQAVAAESRPSQPAVPDRHIFRVDAEGGAHATGETAPPTPSRAIAPWNRKRGDVAVEAPPPVLTAPAETVKTTRPARRRRSAGGNDAPGRGGQLEAAAPVRALPAPARPQPEPAAAPVPRRSRERKRGPEPADIATAPRAAAPAPVAKPATRARKTAEAAAPAAAAKKASTPRAAGAKKAPAAKATAKKAGATKAVAGAKKATSARKAPAAKKATTARKKG
jgi:ribonuclease G